MKRTRLFFALVVCAAIFTLSSCNSGASKNDETATDSTSAPKKDVSSEEKTSEKQNSTEKTSKNSNDPQLEKAMKIASELPESKGYKVICEPGDTEGVVDTDGFYALQIGNDMDGGTRWMTELFIKVNPKTSKVLVMDIVQGGDYITIEEYRKSKQ